ncbi:MAG: lipoprotein signal peptidase [Candidatus Pseudobacter hemicellulosilyticus]|uniref:Lipoprotein signal peptidase n=1 Tax=Candidatus Pseudobacter hemicellulosilyticus TaxID=3121375 RepID=A0AAJ5WS90_9BACT|nr:MAG: lipoprotein signal peptidase [Pseudobacter sp.]
MKSRTVALIIIAIILADQVLKFWVKTGMNYGQQIPLMGNWFRLFFIENEGMAWGWKFGGEWGKLALTLFRLVAVIFGVFYIRGIVQKKYHPGFIVCVAMIFAGALGNLIDSMFYGLIFSASDHSLPMATLFPAGGGYAGFLHGKVVDMLYVPIIENKVMPSWIPIWGGERFTFFSPIFNIADASISVGVIVILLFQRKFFRKHPHQSEGVEKNATVNEAVGV